MPQKDIWVGISFIYCPLSILSISLSSMVTLFQPDLTSSSLKSAIVLKREPWVNETNWMFVLFFFMFIVGKSIYMPLKWRTKWSCWKSSAKGKRRCWSRFDTHQVWIISTFTGVGRRHAKTHEVYFSPLQKTWKLSSITFQFSYFF